MTLAKEWNCPLIMAKRKPPGIPAGRSCVPAVVLVTSPDANTQKRTCVFVGLRDAGSLLLCQHPHIPFLKDSLARGLTESTGGQKALILFGAVIAEL